MAQHDYNIANQSGADFRSDLNNALSAIASTNSGDTAPATTFANQLWIDTANNLLKIRNEANSAWITTGISITADNTFDIDGGTINGITAFNTSANLTLNGAGQQINFTGGGTNKITSNTSLNLDFDTDNDQSGMDFTISHNGGTNLFAINNSGYVGIGTDDPDESLVISGTGDLYAKITTTNDTDEVGILFGDTSASQAGRIVYEPNFDIMQFWTNNSEKYRVDTNGNMYIGRTDGNVSTSEHGVAFTNVGRIKNSVNVAGGGVVTEMYGTAGQFRIKGDGDAENTNNSYGAISDERLKENIANASPKLEKLKQVQVKTFNLVDHDLKQIGVIAQELEDVFPSLVKDNDDGYKTVKYSVFVPILIKAIQELEQQVADLTQRLDGE